MYLIVFSAFYIAHAVKQHGKRKHKAKAAQHIPAIRNTAAAARACTGHRWAARACPSTSRPLAAGASTLK